tara:strand:+ start:3025 stop:3381 length:357 start_codon:yes stop_codon:yes gene_type:complete
MAYKDKKDQARASKKHYDANKKKIKHRSYKRNKVQRAKNIAYVKEIKRTTPCVDCGELNPVLLEFDHVRGDKYRCISDMVMGSYSIETIQKEIDKCDVRCANCHRLITHKRRVKKKDE